MSSYVTVLKAEMVNYAGFNVYRHTKDPSDKKRRTALLCVIAFLLLALIGYVTGAAFVFEDQGSAPDRRHRDDGFERFRNFECGNPFER